MNVDIGTSNHEDRHPAPQHTISLHVRYIGARHPYEEPKADAKQTLAALKPRVLSYFKLTEGAANGGTKVYEFAHNGLVVVDPSRTLGDLAGKHHDLKLDLLERFEQG